MSEQAVKASVGANAWGWRPWGLPFAVGMALHSMDDHRYGPWSAYNHAEKVRRYPDNLFVQNALEADRLICLHRLARAMPCHDRPERFVRMTGACGRPTNGIVQPHALHAMEAPDAA